MEHGAVGRVDGERHAAGLRLDARDVVPPADLEVRQRRGTLGEEAFDVVLLQVDEGRTCMAGLGQQVEGIDLFLLEEHLADVPRHAFGHHALAPRVTVLPQALQLGGQFGVLGVREVAEDVDAVAFVDGGEFDAGDDLHTQLVAGGERLVQPVDGVVVRQGHGGQASLDGQFDHLPWRERAVGEDGMDVQVDAGHGWLCCHTDRGGSSGKRPIAPIVWRALPLPEKT